MPDIILSLTSAQISEYSEISRSTLCLLAILFSPTYYNKDGYEKYESKVPGRCWEGIPNTSYSCTGVFSISKNPIYVSLCQPPAPWASCQIRKIASAHAPGIPGTFSPSTQVRHPDTHHGTCVTHVP